MRDYDQALLYADSCLQLNSYTLDLNTITLTGNFPFTETNNKEVIYVRYMNPVEILTFSLLVVPPAVYDSFADNDLRKTAFFRKNTDGTYRFTLTRTVNDKVYTLPANDLRFALQIPDDVIAMSEMMQNPR